ncbi:SnoaL family polyketide cyclase [Balamuthia mandrillaris]
MKVFAGRLGLFLSFLVVVWFCGTSRQVVEGRIGFECTEQGACRESEPPAPPKDEGPYRCTIGGQCETSSRPIETRVSATGQELKDKALRLVFEIWAGNDFSRAEEFISDKHVFSSPMLKRPLLGLNGLQQYNDMTRTSFSDYSYFVDDLITDGSGSLSLSLSRLFCICIRRSTLFCCSLELIPSSDLTGSKVVIRYQFFGTNTGTYQGVPATGRFVKVSDCVAILDFWDGRIIQTLMVWPHHHLLSQLSEPRMEPSATHYIEDK